MASNMCKSFLVLSSVLFLACQRWWLFLDQTYWLPNSATICPSLPYKAHAYLKRTVYHSNLKYCCRRKVLLKWLCVCTN